MCVVGTQRNLLNETVPMSTENKYWSKCLTFVTSVGLNLSTKKCVVGSQRNNLNETVPMSTQNKWLGKCLTNLLGVTHIFFRFRYECGSKYVNRDLCCG